MTQAFFQAEQLANEWSTRICSRLSEIGVNATEIEETRVIIQAFTKTAAEELSRERTITLPYTTEVLQLNAEQAHQIIDLFLRGVNHVAKKLRDGGQSWEERKPVLESMAWKLFNLGKLLIGFMYIPNPSMQNFLNTPKDMQLMMKQSADMLLEAELNGGEEGVLPFLQ